MERGVVRGCGQHIGDGQDVSAGRSCAGADRKHRWTGPMGAVVWLFCVH